MKTRKGDVFFSDTLIEHGLNIGFRKNATATRNFIDFRATSSIRFKHFRFNAKEFGNLIDKCSRTTSANTIHAHITCYQFTCGSVFFKENNFGILTTKFDRDSCFRISCSDCKSISYDFLNKERTSRFSKGLTTASTKSDLKNFIWK